MTGKMKKLLFGQTGAALVIALVMIVVLTLIGLASTYTSIFEIKLSGNKRGTTDAFYAADGGAQAVMVKVTENFDVSTYMLIPNSSSLPPDLRNESIDGSKSSSLNFSFPSGFTFTDTPSVTIYHTTRTGAVRGSAFSATGNYDFVYYLIESTGKDQLESGLFKSTSTVRQTVYRLIPTAQGGN